MSPDGGGGLPLSLCIYTHISKYPIRNRLRFARHCLAQLWAPDAQQLKSAERSRACQPLQSNPASPQCAAPSKAGLLGKGLHGVYITYGVCTGYGIRSLEHSTASPDRNEG